VFYFVFTWFLAVSSVPSFALISAANVMKAFSTFELFLAEASMNLMPKLSANSLPSSNET